MSAGSKKWLTPALVIVGIFAAVMCVRLIQKPEKLVVAGSINDNSEKVSPLSTSTNNRTEFTEKPTATGTNLYTQAVRKNSKKITPDWVMYFEDTSTGANTVVDLSFKKELPVADKSILAEFKYKLNPISVGNVYDLNEEKTREGIENALGSVISMSKGSSYVGLREGYPEGYKAYYFYTDDKALSESIKHAMSAFGREYTFSTSSDPDWVFYKNNLYPGQEGRTYSLNHFDQLRNMWVPPPPPPPRIGHSINSTSTENTVIVPALSTTDEVKIQNCAAYALSKLEQEVKQSAGGYIPALSGRRSVSYQVTHYNSSKKECIVWDTYSDDKFGTSTLVDAFANKEIAFSVADYNAPALESSDAVDPTCKINGISGCTNGQFIDFVHQKIEGDVTNTIGWVLSTSSPYSYQILFPEMPYLAFSDSQKQGDVLGVESWVTKRDIKNFFSIISWKYNFTTYQVLDLSKPLKELVNNFLGIVSVQYPDAKLIMTQSTKYIGNQALDFKIQSGTTIVKGRAFYVADKSYLLYYECDSTACNDITYYEFLNSFHILN